MVTVIWLIAGNLDESYMEFTHAASLVFTAEERISGVKWDKRYYPTFYFLIIIIF